MGKERREERKIMLLTSNVIRTKDQTPHAIKFWEPPIMISPREANCWTACSRFVNRGPKQRLPLRLAQRSISAVSRMTSLTFGGDSRVCDLEIRNAAFCSPDRAASYSETACAKRISGFSLAELAKEATSMVHRVAMCPAKGL